MKTKIVIGLVLVTALFLYQQNGEYIPAEEEIVPRDAPQSAMDKQLESGKDKILENTVTIKSVLDAEKEQQIIKTKTELENLMIEYNDNLKNLENRKLLETKIAVLIDQYNRLMLPVALDKVKGSDNPQS